MKTVQRWISVVNASGLIVLVHPYSTNYIKRMIRSPKLYFMDTGLLCYLTGWITPESAQNGAMAGHIFETFVVSEILKSYRNAGRDLSGISYYRDKDQNEIDLIIEENRTLYPVEIKKAATVQKRWAKPFSLIRKVKDREIGPGTVLSMTRAITPLSETVRVVPIEYI